MKLKIFLSSLLLLSLTACNSGNPEVVSGNNEKPELHFESPEHFLLGSSVLLKYADKQEYGDKAMLMNIKLKSGKTQQLSFAQIVYLAGDFMGDPETPVGSASSEKRINNFKTNFDVMTKAPAKDYLPEIIKIVDEELNANLDNIKNHEEISIPEEDNIRFNCATGGGCNSATFLFNYGLYMKLAVKNYDHFGKDAIQTYLTGHRLALETAKTATSDNELSQSYAYEAYADHYLTDLYAAGHLRTPRRDIVNWCAYTPSDISSYLTKVMHDQDNKSGVWMINGKGEKWKTYGDHSLFINDNSQSMQRAMALVQKLNDQLYAVHTGKLDIDSAYAEAVLELPDLKAINEYPENNKALFKVENNKVYEYYNNKYAELSNCYNSAIWHGWDNYVK